MNKGNKLLLAISSAFLLVSCSNDNSSSVTEDATSSSETISEDWSEDDKILIQKYCGEVLPYPSGLLNGEVSVDEINDESTNTSFLQIRDTASSFSLQDYYIALENSGWNGVRNYNDDIAQKDASGSIYYELTKIDETNKIGYIISYSFYQGSETEASCNYIQCYNDFDALENPDSDWSDDEKDGFITFVTDVVPFIKFGKNYVSQAIDANSIALLDNYAKNIIPDYVALLKNNGYVYSKSYSEENNCYFLMKQFSDGGIITASLYYFSGNRAYFSYYPNQKTSTTWPSSFIDEYTKELGITLPSFEADDIEQYIYYKKNGNAYILAKTKDENIEGNYTSKLTELGLFAESYTSYSNWDETLDVFARGIYDSYNNQIGFGIVVSLTEPTRKFSSSWPSDAISSFLKSADVSINPPTFTSLSSSKELKYEVIDYNEELIDEKIAYIKEYGKYYYPDIDLTDEKAVRVKAIELAKEDSGVYIYVYDPEILKDENDESSGYCKFYEDFSNFMVSNAYHKGVNDQDELTFEDATGAVALTLTYSSKNKVSKVHVYLGSEEEHEPVFEFTSSVQKYKIGESRALSYEVDMLPYAITFSSSDTSIATVDDKGIVTVSESANVNDEVTITASMQVPGETIKREITCLVKVISNVDYTFESAIKAVADTYNKLNNLSEGDDGYATYHESTRDFDEGFHLYYLKINLGSKTVDETKSYVTDNLVPDGFYLTVDSKWSSGTISPEDELDKEYKDTFIDYYFDEERILLSFFVYTDSNNSTILYVLSMGSDN